MKKGIFVFLITAPLAFGLGFVLSRTSYQSTPSFHDIRVNHVKDYVGLIQPEGPETVSTNQYTLRFQVISRAVPNQNRGQDPDVRVDYAAPLGEVKFSLGETTGISLTPLDGHIDEVVEDAKQMEKGG